MDSQESCTLLQEDAMAKMNQTLNFVLAVLLPLTCACSLMFDRGIKQCAVDSDCAPLETGDTAHAVCSQNVCVDSGLGPKGCLADPPTATIEYLNACTAAQNMPFDNCARLGLCGSGTPLPDSVAPPSVAAVAATISAVTPPTIRCADAGTDVIYMTGTSDFGPLLKQVTPLLAANTPSYRAVFMPGTSCGGVNAVFNPATTVIKDVPGTQTKAASYAYYFDNAGTQVSCTLDPEGKTVDVGVSNLYSTVCDSTYVPGATVTGYLGPVVTFGLTVPAASTQKSISVEAAHLIFGLGGQSSAGLRASPWIDPTYYSIRNSGAGSTASRRTPSETRLVFPERPSNPSAFCPSTTPTRRAATCAFFSCRPKGSCPDTCPIPPTPPSTRQMCATDITPSGATFTSTRRMSMVLLLPRREPS